MKRTDVAHDLAWVALSLSPHIGAKTLHNLHSYFDGDLDAVLSASPQDLQQVSGIGKSIARDIAGIDLCKVATDLAAWRYAGIDLLTRRDADYPELLNQVHDAPPTLFASGCLNEDTWSKTIAIVGTRQPSTEARYLTLQLAMRLARAEYTVVSGLALGVDTAAHVSALEAEGTTIAVLGSGLLNIYPQANRQLAERIHAAGALLSEAHPRWSANAQRLVSRNRIISGMSQAVILVESNADGGAMYTARFAREQGRPVYTFDLPASGNQKLIQQGAIALKRDNPLGFLLG